MGASSLRTGRDRQTAGSVHDQPADRMNGRPGDPTAIDAVAADARPADVALLGLVPVALLVVFLLPPSMVDSWRLAILDPTLPAAYLSHFVHGTGAHLVANLAGYALLAPLTYVLCLSAGRRREFLVAFATFLLALPVVLSGLNLALVRPSVGYGFSGIVMALLGLLPLAVGWHVDARFDAPVDGASAPFGFFLGAGVIATIAVPPSPLRLSAVVLAAGAGVAYLRSATVAAGGMTHLVTGRDAAAPGRVELAVVGLVAVAVFPLAAFPPAPAGPGVVVNVYEHVLGYCLGFVAPYVTFLVLDRTGVQIG